MQEIQTTESRSDELQCVSLPPRVLVVEDDPELRELIRAVLQAEGIEAIALRDGTEALLFLARVAALVERAPDLLVTDVVLPVGDGFGLVESVRCRSLVITAFGGWTARSRARKLGAGFLDKPFSLKELRGEVKRLLDAGCAE